MKTETTSSLVKKIISTPKEKLEELAFKILLCWAIFPIAAMIMNAIGISGVYVYLFWIYLLYLIGAFGLLLGFAYLLKEYYTISFSIGKYLAKYLPLCLFAVFLIWSFFCCLLAENKQMSFFGSIPYVDSWFTFFLYGGFLFSGLIISERIDIVLKLSRVFVVVSVIQAAFTIVNNSVSEAVNTVEPYTNTFSYQSVYYNSNHYGYYLMMSLIVISFLFAYSKRAIEKMLFAGAFCFLICMLILNDTFGSYLSFLIVLVLIVFFSLLERKIPTLPFCGLLALIVFISVESILVTDNVFDNFAGLFGDFSSVANNDNVEYIGSGRGELWKNAIECIKQDPLFGCGFENHGAIRLNAENNLYAYNPHNFLLFFAKYTGIPGLLFYVLALLAMVIRLIRRDDYSIVTIASAFFITSYLMSAFFGVSKFYTAPYYVIILGICMKECVYEKRTG